MVLGDSIVVLWDPAHPRGVVTFAADQIGSDRIRLDLIGWRRSGPVQGGRGVNPTNLSMFPHARRQVGRQIIVDVVFVVAVVVAAAVNVAVVFSLIVVVIFDVAVGLLSWLMFRFLLMTVCVGFDGSFLV